MDEPFRAFAHDHPMWSLATVTSYRAWWTYWLQFLNKPWPQAQRTDIEEFQRRQFWTPKLHGGLKSPNTIDQGLRFLRHFYRWAHRRQLVAEDPMQHWLLPRPPQPPRQPLSWAETLALLNAPDITRPYGLLDLVLIHLLYQGLSLEMCRRLRLDDLAELPPDAALQAALERYLRAGRPALQIRSQETLLLSRYGKPFATIEGLRQRLRIYNDCLNRSLTARLLNQSRLAHQAELGQRHSRNSQEGKR